MSGHDGAAPNGSAARPRDARVPVAPPRRRNRNDTSWRAFPVQAGAGTKCRVELSPGVSRGAPGKSPGASCLCEARVAVARRIAPIGRHASQTKEAGRRPASNSARGTTGASVVVARLAIVVLALDLV